MISEISMLSIRTMTIHATKNNSYHHKYRRIGLPVSLPVRELNIPGMIIAVIKGSIKEATVLSSVLSDGEKPPAL